MCPIKPHHPCLTIILTPEPSLILTVNLNLIPRRVYIWDGHTRQLFLFKLRNKHCILGGWSDFAKSLHPVVFVATQLEQVEV